MAIPLRLTGHDDVTRAEAKDISEHEAAVRATSEESAHVNRESQVRHLSRDAVARYRPLLDRLAR